VGPPRQRARNQASARNREAASGSACGELGPHGSEHESLPRGALLSARKEAEPQGKSKWAELAPGGPIRVLLIFLFYISYFFLFLLNLKFEFDSYYEVQL
jgi:hypothetical protein